MTKNVIIFLLVLFLVVGCLNQGRIVDNDSDIRQVQTPVHDPAGVCVDRTRILTLSGN